jgi:adenylate kinase family enzyme
VQRVVILGPGGAGKTTVAEDIASRTGLPVVFLDPLFWREGWTPAPTDEARRELAGAIAGDRWILDGNFLGPEGTSDARFERADTVVFLDLPRTLCLWRVLSRRVRDRSRSRPDLPKGSREGFDLDLLVWIWRYRAVDRPRVLGLLAQLDDRVAVHHLRSRADVRRFLDRLSSQSASSR